MRTQPGIRGRGFVSPRTLCLLTTRVPWSVVRHKAFLVDARARGRGRASRGSGFLGNMCCPQWSDDTISFYTESALACSRPRQEGTAARVAVATEMIARRRQARQDLGIGDGPFGSQRPRSQLLNDEGLDV